MILRPTRAFAPPVWCAPHPHEQVTTGHQVRFRGGGGGGGGRGGGDIVGKNKVKGRRRSARRRRVEAARSTRTSTRSHTVRWAEVCDSIPALNEKREREDEAGVGGKRADAALTPRPFPPTRYACAPPARGYAERWKAWRGRGVGGGKLLMRRARARSCPSLAHPLPLYVSLRVGLFAWHSPAIRRPLLISSKRRRSSPLTRTGPTPRLRISRAPCVHGVRTWWA